MFLSFRKFICIYKHFEIYSCINIYANVHFVYTKDQCPQGRKAIYFIWQNEKSDLIWVWQKYIVVYLLLNVNTGKGRCLIWKRRYFRLVAVGLLSHCVSIGTINDGKTNRVFQFSELDGTLIYVNADGLWFAHTSICFE